MTEQVVEVARNSLPFGDGRQAAHLGPRQPQFAFPPFSPCEVDRRCADDGADWRTEEQKPVRHSQKHRLGGEQ